MADEPSHVIVRTGGGAGRRAVVAGRLCVGRECPGADPERRLLIDDPHVSRSHLEIRVGDDGEASVIDTSTNGTLLNGARLERAVPVALRAGDVLRLGETVLEFHAPRRPESGVRRVHTTHALRVDTRMALVAGDIVSYSTLSEHSSSAHVADSVRRLFGELQGSLRAHGGVLSHLAGDAMLAAWNLEESPAGVDLAVEFALEAVTIVARVGPVLELRHPDGSPLSMGFGVSTGRVSLSHITAGRSTVLGDAANVAFRLSSIAGRDGRADVLVTADVAAGLRRSIPLGPAAPIPVKGRETPVQVQPVHPAVRS